MPVDNSSTHVSRVRVALLLLLAVSMVSSASILIRFSTSNPLTIVFWRTFFGALIMMAVGGVRGDWHAYWSSELHARWPALLLIGAMLSFHFSTWFVSLFLTTVAASVVLVDMSPIFTAIISVLLLGETMRSRTAIGILVATGGAIMLAMTDFASVIQGAFLGDLLALASSIFLALYFIGGQKHARGLPNSIYTSVVYMVAAGVTLILCMALRVDVFVFDPREILIFIALAVFPTALGHSVNNYLLTIVPAYVVSSAVLGEPVGATILAAVFLSEVPPPMTLVYFGVILSGIGIVLADQASDYAEKMGSSRGPRSVISP